MKIKKLIEKINDFFEFTKKRKTKKLNELIEKLKEKKNKLKHKLEKEDLKKDKRELLENELAVVTTLISKAKKEL
ncbi:MAG: hypothetical protein ACNI3C_10260 [Candidatus Marinarcus sp.]|uniref:hypothetical protein n=1 Tax=Candidatus Marinarcus sp. TaxID=3100987 RepID=UPI003B009CE3